MCEAMRMLMWDEIEEGRQKGREEGIQEGRKKGKEEGKKEGRQEQARETAYKLRDMGLPADKIASAVSVSLETVQEWFAKRTAPAKSAAPL